MIQRFTALLAGCLASLALATPCTAVELTSPVTVTATDNGVVLSWKTDVICGTKVAYGTHSEMLPKKAEGALGLYHEVTLTDLLPGKTYFVRAGTARQWLAEGRLTLTTEGTPSWSPGFEDPKPAVSDTAEETKKPTPRPLPKLAEGSTDQRPPASATETPQKAAPPRAPPTHETWGYMPSLQDHYERHGKDFRCTSPDDYAAKAWLFLQYARQNSLPMKWDDADGTLRIWEPNSRAFAAYNRDGTTKTFFRPNSPGYWSRQPGRPIKPSELPF